MGDRIGKQEDVGAALIRLVRDDLAGARAGLTGNGPADRRIHRARQRLKRARSVLKVLRPILGETALTARRKIAEAARLLSGARDADAAAASARGLRDAAEGDKDAALDRLVATLDREARAHHARAPAMAAAGMLIGEAEGCLASLVDDVGGSALLEQALARAYRRGRKSFRRAQASLSVPDLHRWRKHVKHLWHLLRLARKRLPGEAEKTAAQLESLGELLGLDHDHAVLAAKLAEIPRGDPVLSRPFALIAEKRRVLEAKAFALGKRLYGKSPKQLDRLLRLD